MNPEPKKTNRLNRTRFRQRNPKVINDPKVADVEESLKKEVVPKTKLKRRTTSKRSAPKRNHVQVRDKNGFTRTQTLSCIHNKGKTGAFAGT